MGDNRNLERTSIHPPLPSPAERCLAGNGEDKTGRVLRGGLKQMKMIIKNRKSFFLAKSLLITSLFGCFTHGVREQDEEPVCSPHKELMCAKEITRKTYWLKHLPQPDNGSSEREKD